LSKARSRGWVTLEMYFDSSIRNRSVASHFFSTYGSIFPELEFQLMGQWEPLRERFDRERALLEWEGNRGAPNRGAYGHCIFFGNNPAQFHVIVSWYGLGAHPRWVDSLAVSFEERFWLDGLLKDPMAKTIALLRGLSKLASPLYGRAFHSSEFESKFFRDHILPSGKVSQESISLTPREGLIDLFWVDYFGKRYVNLFGERSLAKVDCLFNEKVGDDFFLAFSKDPFGWNDPAVRTSQDRAKQELNHNAFFEKVTGFRPSLDIGLSNNAQPARE